MDVRISTEGITVVACYDMPIISFASSGDTARDTYFYSCSLPRRRRLLIPPALIKFCSFPPNRITWISSPMWQKTTGTAELVTSSNAEVSAVPESIEEGYVSTL
jgi:hypothetical protein